MNDPGNAKPLARTTARAARDALTPQERNEQGRAITSRLVRMPAVRDASRICCFVSFRSEVPTHRLIEQWLGQGKEVCVPWCAGDNLRLVKINSLDELEKSSLGILEPARVDRSRPEKQVDIRDVPVAVVPGLAFTADGKRLGYGRGYYDRLLSGAIDTVKIALAFDCQIVADLPVTASDIGMDAIVTETRMFRTSDVGG